MAGAFRRFVSFGKQSSKVIIATLVGVLIGGLGLAAVRAAVPDAQGDYHACYDNSSGAVRVIDTGAQFCSGSETAMAWSGVVPGHFVSNLANADFSNADIRYR